MDSPTLCETCFKYVLCENEKDNFCLARDLYTHTAKSVDECCIDYVQGEPMTEDELETI